MRSKTKGLPNPHSSLAAAVVSQSIREVHAKNANVVRKADNLAWLLTDGLAWAELSGIEHDAFVDFVLSGCKLKHSLGS